MRKFLCLLALLSIGWLVTEAQSRKVTGTVTDGANGDPLVGVTVRVANTQTGTQTDADGKFSLTIPSDAKPVLQLSYLGYESKTVTATTGKSLTVQLTAKANSINEVVVVGYGTVKRKDLTASVSSVNAKQLKDVPINSAEEALAGRLAGVQVTGSEGSPDAEVKIRVRGGGSITQDNSPLYVVDGVIQDNALSTLSPQDIESIDVLKDASATAIYGARGANGVVIITTKGGHAGKTTLSYNGFLGVQQLENKLKVLDPYNFVKYQYERAKLNGDTTTYIDMYGTHADMGLYKEAPFVDWQDQVFGRNAMTQTHNVSVSGGDEKTTFNLSLTDNETQGIMQGSGFNRKLVNFRLNHKVSDKFKFAFNVKFNNQTVDGAGTSNPGSSATNFLRQAVKFIPFLLPGQNLGSYDANLVDQTNGNSLFLVNPLLLQQAEYKKQYQTVANFSGYADYSFTKFLSLRTTMGYDYNSRITNQYDDTLTYNSRANGNLMPIADIENQKNLSFDMSNVLNFSNDKLKGDFNKNNSINVILGQETYEKRNKSHEIEQRYFPVGTSPEKALGNLALASPPTGFQQPSPTSNEVIYRISSYFGRINYSYKDKYLATVNFRADGSSVFDVGRKWGYFPSASLAWRASEERFMDRLKPVISDLKFRLSYGEAGNNRINAFLYDTQFSTDNTFYGLSNQLTSGLAPEALANALLQWETTISRDAGVDISFFKDRLRLSADVYANRTKNLLVNVPVPTTSGYTNQIQNVGATSNKGVELQLSTNIVETKNFTWAADFNISFNKNKIKDLGRQQLYLQNSGWAGGNNPDDYIVKVGEPVGTMYGLVNDGYYTLDDFNYDKATQTYTLKDGVANDTKITGIDPAPGVMKYKDLNGDGIVDLDDDRQIIGNANPKFFGGLNQQFTFWNFDASIFVNFQYGNDIFNANKLEFSNGYTPNANMLDFMKNRWRDVNDAGEVVTDPAELAALNKNATIWHPLTTGSWSYPQSWAIEDGSFMRINNITLGYTLPKSITDKVKIQRFRIYATMNNLAVITGYSGYDPEVNTRRGTPVTPGVDYSAYPRSHDYIFGVNVTF